MTTGDENLFAWDSLGDDDFLAVEEPKQATTSTVDTTEQGGEKLEDPSTKIDKIEAKKDNSTDTAFSDLSDEDFFTVTNEPEDTTPTGKEVGDKEKVKQAAVKANEKPTVSSDNKQGNKSGETETQATEAQPDDVSAFYKAKAELMMKSGVFATISEEDIPEEGLDEEGYKELQSKELDNRVNSIVEGWREKIGDEGAAFIKYTMSGGSAATFIQEMGKEPDLSSFDLEKDDQVEQAALTYFTKIEGKTGDEAKDLVEYFKDKGVLKERVTKWSEQVKTRREEKEKQLVEEQEKRSIQNEKARKARKKKLTEIVNTVDSVSGVKIQKAAKSTLAAYLADTNQKVEGRNQYISQFSADLQQIFQDENSLLALASIVSRYDKDNKKFDLSDIEAEGKKKKVKEVANTLYSTQEGNNSVAKSAATPKVQKSLAELLG